MTFFTPNELNTHRTKSMVAIAIIFVLAISATLTGLPTIQATTYPIYAYVNFAPNPIGVGQTGICLFFLDRPAPTAVAGFGSATNWNGFKLTVTTPDGNNQSFGPFTSDATGGYFVSYTPDKVGNYTFQFDFPGQLFRNGAYVVGPASAKTTLVVTQEQTPFYQTPPVPTNYWSFPIYGENRGWDVIAGNWLMQTYNQVGGPYNPYTIGPQTAHIVWMRKQYMGGVVGATQVNTNLADWNYYQAPTYQPYLVPPLVISGRLYYMQREVPGNGWVGMHCVDISTGKDIWFQPASVIGQIGPMGGGATANIYGELFDAESINGHGYLPYFWNVYGNQTYGNYTMFEANSGLPILVAMNAPTTANSPGVTGPRFRYDEHGSFIAYYINGANHWLCMWNSTLLVTNSTGVNSVYTPPVGAVIPWQNGIQWNVTIPINYPGEIPGFIIGVPMATSKVIFAHTGSISLDADNDTVEAYDANTGAQLWYHTFGEPYITGATPYEFFGPTVDNVICVYQKATHQWYGYDVNTGAKLWGPTAATTEAWDTFIAATAAQGNLYVSTYGGKVYNYDLKNGTLKWTFSLPPNINTPYGSNPLAGDTNAPFSTFTVADGKLYIQTGEHTPNSPYWLGGAMYCINATDGTLVYSMSGWWTSPVVAADGMIFGHNCYDGNIYGFGKGQTAVTVSTPDNDLSQGQGLTIKGTVMDESPGSLDYTGTRISMKSTPAIADPYMTQWMEYLYQQKTMPTNATGVPVVLSVIDANNNNRVIGTTTSNTDGFFSFNWKPDIVGNYTLTASFQGSESYYPSHAVTAFNVVPVSSTAKASTSAPLSTAEAYFMPAMIAITIVLIVILVLLALILLRKRP